MEMAFHNSSSCGREIWVSPQPLATESPPIRRTTGQPHFPFEFPYEQSLSSESSFSSPVESLVASPNETESEDDDDYTAGLAERIAHSMLDDDDEDASNEKFESGNTNLPVEQIGFWASDATKVCFPASPPHATYPSGGSWSTRSWSSCSTGSSNGSSRVSSQVSSPSSTPMASQGDAWDLLYAAAGEMLRLKMLEESKGSAAACFHLQNVAQQVPTVRCNQTQQAPWIPTYTSLVHPIRPSSSCGHGMDPAARSNSFSSAVPGLCKDANVAPASRFQRSMSLSTKEMLKLQTPVPDPCYGSSVWSRHSRTITQNTCGSKSGLKSGCNQRARWSSDVSTSQWPPLQPSMGSGMRAVFLGSNASGRESTGTGVFLPRRGPECKKKPSCSTVLLPTRIVQALNLNVEDVHSLPMARSKSIQWIANGRDCTSLPSSPSLSTAAAKTGGREAWSDSTKKLLYTSPLKQETSLPTEWTY